MKWVIEDDDKSAVETIESKLSRKRSEDRKELTERKWKVYEDYLPAMRSENWELRTRAGRGHWMNRPEGQATVATVGYLT